MIHDAVLCFRPVCLGALITPLIKIFYEHFYIDDEMMKKVREVKTISSEHVDVRISDTAPYLDLLTTHLCLQLHSCLK